MSRTRNGRYLLKKGRSVARLASARKSLPLRKLPQSAPAETGAGRCSARSTRGRLCNRPQCEQSQTVKRRVEFCGAYTCSSEVLAQRSQEKDIEGCQGRRT